MKKTFSEMKLERHIPTLISSWRQKEGGAFLSDKEYNSVSNSLLQLQRGLTGKRDLIGVNYMNDKNFLGAYLLYYWPVSYLQISYAALSVKGTIEALCKKAVEENRAVKVLDLGSGPGPACSAVSDIILECMGQNASLKVTLVDQSEKSLNLAKEIFNHDFKGVKVSTLVSDFEKAVSLEKLGDASFDMIVMSHAINELWKGKSDFIEKRCGFLEKCVGYVSEGGFMLIAEPALLETSRSLLKVRDGMLEKGVQVVSPCASCKTGSCATKCPAILAGENQTCHGEVLWKPCEPVAGIAKRAGLDRESVKMSFIVLKNEMAEEASVEEESVSSKNKPLAEITGRVVSDAMLNKAGRLRFVICNGKERITVSAKQGDPVASEKGFFSLKRFDRVEILKPEIRGDKNNISYGVDAGTEIKIERFVK